MLVVFGDTTKAQDNGSTQPHALDFKCPFLPRFTSLHVQYLDPMEGEYPTLTGQVRIATLLASSMQLQVESGFCM